MAASSVRMVFAFSSAWVSVGDVLLHSKRLQHVRHLKRQDHSDEEEHQRHDAHRAEADPRHLKGRLVATDSSLAQQWADRHPPEPVEEEVDEPTDVLHEIEHASPDSFRRSDHCSVLSSSSPKTRSNCVIFNV